MHRLRNLARRIASLFAALGLLGGIGFSALPMFASADALNPLLERSLTLSSSSPGWSYLDGFGSTLNAPPNSGANGKQTGNTFAFKTFTASALIKGFSFQYCTSAAGTCLAPGNNGWAGLSPSATRNADSVSTTDLNVVTSSPTEISNTNWTNTIGPVGSRASHIPLADGTEGNFVVLVNGTVSAGWTMTAVNNETGTPGTADATGKNNYIKLVNGSGQTITAGQPVQIIFFGTTANYLTNPGAGAFFARINDYNDAATLDNTTVVDGGVTVANVINQSISIQTKVLETMSFSVGVHDPNADAITPDFTTNTGIATHGQCDAILTRDNPGATPAIYSATPQNVLKLGNPSADYTLEPGTTWGVNSYWRLSSNSSGGATVYYTGSTLTDAGNDQISPLTDGNGSGTGTASQTGTEQFGLGIDHGAAPGTVGGIVVGDVFPVGDTYDSAFNTLVGTGPDEKYHAPRLYPLVATSPYGSANGTITSGGTAKFSFNANAGTIAVPVASESASVVNCVTAKMRYIANIAATTPAGVYTTKINYVAAPQY